MQAGRNLHENAFRTKSYAETVLSNDRGVFSSPYLPNPLLPTAVIARELKEADCVTAGAFTSHCNIIYNHLVYDL